MINESPEFIMLFSAIRINFSHFHETH